MKNPSDNWDALRKAVLGLGENSVRKSHYPRLMQRLAELERFRSLVDISSDLLFVIELPHGRIRDASAASFTRLAMTRDQLLALSLRDVLPTESWRTIESLQDESNGGPGVAKAFTTELISPTTGSKFPVEIAAHSIQVGNSVLAVLAARDVTERLKAEQRILKLNRLYKVVTEVNKVLVKAETRGEMFDEVCRVCCEFGRFKLAWIGVFHQSGGLRCIASAGASPLLSITGCETDCGPCAGVVRTGEHFVCNQMEDSTGCCHDEATKRGYRSSCVVPLRLRHSVLGALALYSSDPEFFDREELELLDGVGADISFAIDALSRQEERSLAERALQETHRKVEAILRASPVAIVALDVHGRVTSWNRASETLFGWAQSEIIGKPSPLVPEAVEGLSGTERAGGAMNSTEVKIRRRDGLMLDVSFSTAPLESDQGQTTGTMAIYADISDRKRLEMMLHQSQKLESIGQLAGGIAHDFNNLLTVINGHSEILESRLDTVPDISGHVTAIRSAGLQAAELTAQLLAFSRKQVLQPKVVSLNSIVSGMQGMLRRLIGENVNLVVELDKTARHIKADPGQIQQVIMNLVVNARDAVRAGGTIRICTRSVSADSIAIEVGECHAGQYVALAVSDNGSGIDDDTRKRIFEPFFTTKDPGKGTGLGLATVWGIVNQSGGHVLVESVLGEGSTFTTLLPVSNEAVEANRIELITGGKAGHETLLLVEDRDDVRQLTAEILRNSGYEVLEANLPTKAIEIWASRRHELSLVVTDVVMPEMNGTELVDYLRERDPSLKVVFISGHMGESILGPNQLNPRTTFLDKPFSAEQLLRAISGVLENDRAEERA